MKAVVIPSGSILNCYLPRKNGSLKRWIMNLEASLFFKKYGIKLNHTAVIENDNGNVLIWEAAISGGVRPTVLDMYTNDALFTITVPPNPKQGLKNIKSQASKKYDFRSWWINLKFVVTGKWSGDTTEPQYSAAWFCSELVDWANNLTATPYQSTPNHVFEATKNEIVWKGSYNELVAAISNKSVIIL